jgi:hypothetical protein
MNLQGNSWSIKCESQGGCISSVRLLVVCLVLSVVLAAVSVGLAVAAGPSGPVVRATSLRLKVHRPSRPRRRGKRFLWGAESLV